MNSDRLIREVILPQLIQLQAEIAALRKHTWPYVQSQKEQNQLDDIEAKRDFIKNLDEDTIKELLNIKAKYSGSSNLQKTEYELLKKIICPV